MSIPYRVQDYIARRGLPWDPLAHEATSCTLDAAHLAHLDPREVAKAVVLKTPRRISWPWSRPIIAWTRPRWAATCARP